jgi:hypothetical protein
MDKLSSISLFQYSPSIPVGDLTDIEKKISTYLSAQDFCNLSLCSKETRRLMPISARTLHESIEKSHEFSVQFFISSGAVSDGDRELSVYAAVEKNQLDLVKKLLPLGLFSENVIKDFIATAIENDSWQTFLYLHTLTPLSSDDKVKLILKAANHSRHYCLAFLDCIDLSTLDLIDKRGILSSIIDQKKVVIAEFLLEKLEFEIETNGLAFAGAVRKGLYPLAVSIFHKGAISQGMLQLGISILEKRGETSFLAQLVR